MNEEIQKRVEQVLDKSALSQADMALWRNVFERNPTVVQVYALSVFEDAPDMVAVATEDMRRKLACIDTPGEATESVKDYEKELFSKAFTE